MQLIERRDRQDGSNGRANAGSAALLDAGAAYTQKRNAALAEARAFHAETAGSNLGVRVTLDGPRRSYLEVYRLAPVVPGNIGFDVLLSGVSTGTEGKVIRGETAYQEQGRPKLGYEEAGETSSTMNDEVPVDTTIASNVGRKTAAEGIPNRYVKGKSLIVAVPGIDLDVATEIAHMGGVGNNGLAKIDAHFRGEDHFRRLREQGLPIEIGSSTRGKNVLVVGGGMVGLYAAMFLQKAAANVMVADPMPNSLIVPDALGMDTILSDPRDPSVAADAVKDVWRTNGQPGADIVFECSGRHRGGTTAYRAVRDGGTVVNLSYYRRPDANSPADVEEVFEWAEAHNLRHDLGVDEVVAQIGPTHIPDGLDRLDYALNTKELVSMPQYAAALRLRKTHFVPYSEFGAVVEFASTGDASALRDFAVDPSDNIPGQIVTFPDRGLLPLLQRAS